MAIPDWLSIREIARLWGEETGLDALAIQEDLEQWFAEFVKEPSSSRGATFDTITANRLLGMLGLRYFERKTFEAYCEQRGRSKPRFWLVTQEAKGEATRPSLEQPQEELIERMAAASAEAADLRAKLEVAEQRIADLQAEMEENRAPLVDQPMTLAPEADPRSLIDWTGWPTGLGGNQAPRKC